MAIPETPITQLLKRAGMYESHYPAFKEHGISSDMVGDVEREEWDKDLNVPRVSGRIKIRKASKDILAEVHDTPLPPVVQVESLENKDKDPIARQRIDLALWVVSIVFQWAVDLVVLVVHILLLVGRVATLLRESYLGMRAILLRSSD
jgi:hypothetical protein